ncbi:MAG: flavodoxin family protein [Victivallales bacterium]|nr:flavodoxin family protein [Victivallales bacterium]MCF7889478.1 flavodoxin family protein [Victivallales bacterium]
MNKKIKVLAISTSPRKNGNSEILLNSFLKGAEEKNAEIEIIRLSELNIKPWLKPDYNTNSFNSLDEKNIYTELKNADIVVISSPVYFASLPAQLKALIEQAQPIWNDRVFNNINYRNKMADGYFLCVEGSNNKIFFENAKREIKVFFKTVNINYIDDVFCYQVNDVGDINKKKVTLYRAYEIGKISVDQFLSNDHAVK